jgi:hypothetical protein
MRSAASTSPAGGLVALVSGMDGTGITPGSNAASLFAGPWVALS